MGMRLFLLVGSLRNPPGKYEHIIFFLCVNVDLPLAQGTMYWHAQFLFKEGNYLQCLQCTDPLEIFSKWF